MPLQPLSSESNDSPSRKNGKKVANFKVTILGAHQLRQARNLNYAMTAVAQKIKPEIFHKMAAQ